MIKMSVHSSPGMILLAEVAYLRTVAGKSVALSALQGLNARSGAEGTEILGFRAAVAKTPASELFS
jgi:hypothetical protein